jgi:hypothetical protein
VTTALACASGDPNMAVQVKTGIGRFFNDLKKPPYKALFNPSLSGMRAFNAALVQRNVDAWIQRQKSLSPKKSGLRWGVLIHGNRLLAAIVFEALGSAALAMSITDFKNALPSLLINDFCEVAYNSMLTSLEKRYQGKFLAVLFKNPTMCKQIFEDARKSLSVNSRSLAAGSAPVA